MKLHCYVPECSASLEVNEPVSHLVRYACRQHTSCAEEDAESQFQPHQFDKKLKGTNPKIYE